RSALLRSDRPGEIQVRSAVPRRMDLGRSETWPVAEDAWRRAPLRARRAALPTGRDGEGPATRACRSDHDVAWRKAEAGPRWLRVGAHGRKPLVDGHAVDPGRRHAPPAHVQQVRRRPTEDRRGLPHLAGVEFLRARDESATLLPAQPHPQALCILFIVMSKRKASDSIDPLHSKTPEVDEEELTYWLHKRNDLRKRLRRFDKEELDLSVPFEERFEEQAQVARLVLKYERLLHEAEYFEERSEVAAWPRVVIYGTGIEPLNRLLTKFINTPQVDHGGGFMDQIRFPEKSDVLYMLNKREVRDCPLLLGVVEEVGGKNANALDWYAEVVAMESANSVWSEYRKFLDYRQEVAVFPSSSEFSFSTRTSVGKSSTSSQQSGRHSVGVRSRSGSAAPQDASQQSEVEVGARSCGGSAAPQDVPQQSEAEVAVGSRRVNAALQQTFQQSVAEFPASMVKLDDFCFEYVKKLANVAPLEVGPPGESAVVLAEVAPTEPTDDDKWECFSASLPSDSDDEGFAAEPSVPSSAFAAADPSPTDGHELNAIVESGSSGR
ncbi:hypothetical protein AAVH_37123, partial [Aphelenchoides avenae]